MSHPINPIIVHANIGNQQRKFYLYQPFPMAELYEVLCDQEHVADVRMQQGYWKVFPALGRMLDGENCDALLQAVLNVENPNSSEGAIV
jgi:hypothetical protein